MTEYSRIFSLKRDNRADFKSQLGMKNEKNGHQLTIPIAVTKGIYNRLIQVTYTDSYQSIISLLAIIPHGYVSF